MSAVREFAPVGAVGELDVDVVQGGPLLLAAVDAGPGLRGHRAARGAPPEVDLTELERVADRIDLRGRGGAGFPFADKLRAVRRRSRTPVVVNVCEGEPMSAKDSTLAILAPHLILDGAVLTARGTSVAHRPHRLSGRPLHRR